MITVQTKFSVVLLCIDAIFFVYDCQHIITLQLFVKNILSTMAPTEICKLAGGESVDLNGEVYSADISIFQSMDFGPTRTTDVPSNNPNPPSASLPLPLSAADDNKPTKKTSVDALPSPLTLPNSNSVNKIRANALPSPLTLPTPIV